MPGRLTYFEIYRTLFRQWRWRLIAVNGRILASGESFWNYNDCIASIRLVQETSADTPIKSPKP